jgi:glycosyltransferase involved in cell wall biosynthesis
VTELRRLIAYTHARDDPAARFRIGQYIPRFERAGWRVSHRTNHPERPWQSAVSVQPARWAHQRAGVLVRRLWRRWDIRAAAAFDVAFVNRDLLEGRVAYEAALLARNARVIFDFDDAIHLGPKEAHVAWMCERAAWVTAGNDLLADVARRYTDRVSVVPTAVDTDLYPPPDGARDGAPLAVGWLGSDLSIRETLVPFLPTLAALQAEIGFEFVVVSKPRPNLPATGLRWRYVEWSPAVETRIASLFDVGIMPLADDAFQRGKCGCKLLQYMAAGLPAVASPVGVNTRLLGDGRGFLARDRVGWGDALTRLRDAALRRAQGAAGRAFVEREYSVNVWFPRLFAVVESVRAGERPRGAAVEPPCDAGR